MAGLRAALTFDREPFHVVVPATAATLNGFRAWVLSRGFPREASASWIEGELFIDMSPEAIDTHNTAKAEITSVLRAIARDEEIGELYADRLLFTNAEAGVSTEPDVTLVTFDSIARGRVHFTHKATRPGDRLELQGTPDLLVEILSDSSEKKDESLLRAAYARAGVPEYWLIDARGDRIRFEILVLRGTQYRTARRSRVLRRAFTLDRIENRAGHWDYRLRFRR